MRFSSGLSANPGPVILTAVFLLAATSPGPLNSATVRAADGPVRHRATQIKGADDPALVGSWEGPYAWPVVAIHAFVLPTGDALQYSFTGNPFATNCYVWNPATGEFTDAPVERLLFCSGHSFLPDGRLLVAGGTDTEAPPGEIWGIRDAHMFDPASKSWKRVQDMAKGRWYPSNVTLPDGRVLSLSGLDETGSLNLLAEVYDTANGWQIVATDIGLPLYPWVHVMSNGDIFYSGPSQITAYFSTSSWSFYDVVNSNYGWRGGGVAVLLPGRPDRVMVTGGTTDSVPTATAEILDVIPNAPLWRYTRPMNFPRMHHNGVLLPDGTVLVVGGQSGPDAENVHPPPSAVLEAEIFDPTTETWTVAAAMQRPRVYHSTAVLLFDGRVLVGGTNDEYTTEIYSPPYLFKGPRPEILAAPSTMKYGSSCCVEFSSTTTNNSVSLIRLSAVTHGVNMDQRYVRLADLSCGDGTKSVKSPANAALAPPGFYMLFVVNSDGVPSPARIVQVLDACPGDCDCDLTTGCAGGTNFLVTGDVNQNGVISSEDIIALVNYIFKSDASPLPCEAVGDVNCNGSVTSADIIHEVNHVFKGGPAPCDVCSLIPGVWSCP